MREIHFFEEKTKNQEDSCCFFY